MKDVIHVSCLKQPAAIIDVDHQYNQGRFEWLPAFKNAYPELTEAFLPENGHRCSYFQVDKALPPFLMDYVPGAFPERLLSEFLKQNSPQIIRRSPIAWLSLTGNCGMGGLEFSPFGLPELQNQESIDLDKMVKWVKQLEQPNHTPILVQDMRHLLRSSLFTRGKSPKSLVDINAFTGEVLTGQGLGNESFSKWLIKWSGLTVHGSELLDLEYELFVAAQLCGISCTPYRKIKNNHLNHLLIKRFDIQHNTNIITVSYCNWMQIDGLHWDGVFRRMRILKMPHKDMVEMFKRMAFMTCFHNGCINAKRICFTFDQTSGWRLAPAFNLKACSSQEAYIGHLDQKSTPIKLELLTPFGKYIGIRNAKSIIQEIAAVKQSFGKRVPHTIDQIQNQRP